MNTQFSLSLAFCRASFLLLITLQDLTGAALARPNIYDLCSYDGTGSERAAAGAGASPVPPAGTATPLRRSIYAAMNLSYGVSEKDCKPSPTAPFSFLESDKFEGLINAIEQGEKWDKAFVLAVNYSVPSSKRHKGLLFVREDGHILCAFAGTDFSISGIASIKTDLGVDSHYYLDDRSDINRIRVADFFADYPDSATRRRLVSHRQISELSHRFQGAIYDALSFLKAEKQGPFKAGSTVPISMSLVGHSLGGAIALLASPGMRSIFSAPTTIDSGRLNRDHALNIITFGAPQILSIEAADYMVGKFGRDHVLQMVAGRRDAVISDREYKGGSIDFIPFMISGACPDYMGKGLIDALQAISNTSASALLALGLGSRDPSIVFTHVSPTLELLLNHLYGDLHDRKTSYYEFLNKKIIDPTKALVSVTDTGSSADTATVISFSSAEELGLIAFREDRYEYAYRYLQEAAKSSASAEVFFILATIQHHGVPTFISVDKRVWPGVTTSTKECRLTPDPESAAANFQRAADLGHEIAIKIVSKVPKDKYEVGRALKGNLAKVGARLVEEAASAGYTPALYYLATQIISRYEYKDIPSDAMEELHSLLTRAAAGGFLEAQDLLARKVETWGWKVRSRSPSPYRDPYFTNNGGR